MQTSLWEKESFFAPSDVIIAGSGFVGLWSAYYLKKKQPKLKITVIDSGFIPAGASTRNAGFACFGSVTELMRDVAEMGEEKMLSLVKMRFKGLARIQKVFRKKEIDYNTCGGYELILSSDDNRYKELASQIKWLNNVLAPLLKTKKTFEFSDKKIDRFGMSGIGHIISNDLEGYLHPGKLCLALLHKIQGMGVAVIPATEITHYDETLTGVTVHTDKNIKLMAAQLLVCTNGFAKKLLPQLEIIPARGQVLVTSPVPSLKIKGTFHYDEGYYYFRNVGDRLLLGGARNMAVEEETTFEMDISDKIQQQLEHFMSTYLLPGVEYEITDRWSGIMGMGPEKMPIVKKLSPHTFCAVKMSGMGVALAPVAGETVAKLMLA
jgi:gamma-glutamylputrescine oxidase